MIVCTTPFVWFVRVTLCSGQHRMRRGFRAWLGDPGTAIRPLKFECDCFLTQKNAFWQFGAPSGSGTARHLGPTSRGRLKFGRTAYGLSACVPDPNCSEPSREGHASVCNRAVECRFRAI